MSASSIRTLLTSDELAAQSDQALQLSRRSLWPGERLAYLFAAWRLAVYAAEKAEAEEDA
jgi:hypothetical protein